MNYYEEYLQEINLLSFLKMVPVETAVNTIYKKVVKKDPNAAIRIITSIISNPTIPNAVKSAIKETQWYKDISEVGKFVLSRNLKGVAKSASNTKYEKIGKMLNKIGTNME